MGEADSIVYLEDARKYLRESWKTKKGVSCPCCKQLVKVWRHKVNFRMAHILITMYKILKTEGREYVNIFSELRPKTTMYSLMKFWDLMVQSNKHEIKNSKTSGFWKLTETGILFVESKIEIPKYKYIFNDDEYPHYVDEKPQFISIADSLGQHFDYKELMGDFYLDPKQIDHPEQKTLL